MASSGTLEFFSNFGSPSFALSMQRRKKFTLSAHHKQWWVQYWLDRGANHKGRGAILLFWPIFPENFMNMKKKLDFLWGLNFQPTDDQKSYIITITPKSYRSVSWRHRKVLNSLHSRLGGSSWIHLIDLIKRVQYKIGTIQLATMLFCSHS